MKLTLLVGALAALAAAEPKAERANQLEKKQASAFNTPSALLVLATALPGSLLSLAYTNQAAASTIIASEFAAGATPSWFSALPSDIKTYLVPSATPSTGSGPYSAGNNTSGMGVAGGTAGASGAGATGASRTSSTLSGGRTATTTGGSATTGSSGGAAGGAGGSTQGAGGSSVSSGLGAQATVFMGAVAGAAGLLGVLAL